MPNERTESALAIDCGSTFSKATLIDKVDGEYRFVAVGESLTTPGDASIGLIEAVKDVEEKAGRKLLQNEQLLSPEGLDGNGIDIAVLTCSAGRPTRVIAAGISPSQAFVDASQVVAGANAEVVAVLSVGDIRRREVAEHKIEELHETKADVVFFSAGIGGYNPLVPELATFLARAGLSGRDGTKLPVIFSGDPDSFDSVSKLLGPVTDLRPVEPIHDSSGGYQTAPAVSALNDLFLQHSVFAINGPNSFSAGKWAAVVPVSAALETVTRFIARQIGADVLAVDLGAVVTTVVLAAGGRRHLEVSTDCGMGKGILPLAAGERVEELGRWLPFRAEAEQVLQVALNKGLRPQTVPQLLEEQLIEESIARVAVRKAVKQMSFTSGLIVASGGFFSHLNAQGRLMLLLLDAVQPLGVVSVAYDSVGMLPALGALAAAHPQAAGEVIMNDALQVLGSAITITGPAAEGQPAAVVAMHFADGRELEVQVACGGIETIPLPEGERIKLMVRPEAGFRIGGTSEGRPVEVEVTGGSVGIVIDARGRPLSLPINASRRIEKLSSWNSALEG